MTRRLLVLSLLLAATTSAVAAPPSGRYGPMTLVLRNGMAHGVFSEGRIGNGTDDAPQFSRLFLLEGRIEGQRARIETWFPGEAERIAGTLELGPVPGLRLEDNHGGRAMTGGDRTAEPYGLALDEVHDEWKGVGLVTAGRAVLRPAPIDDPQPTRPDLVRYDAVAVLERRKGWVHVVHLGESEQLASGWLCKDELETTPAERQ